MAVASPHFPTGSIGQVPRQRSKTTENTTSIEDSSRRRWSLHRDHGRSFYLLFRSAKNIDSTQHVASRLKPNSYVSTYLNKSNRIQLDALKMNIFDSKVSFVNIIHAHGLETKDTQTGPTAVVVGATVMYDTYCHIQLNFIYVFGWCH